MLQQNMLHLMPVYWLAMLVTFPLDYVPLWSQHVMSHFEVAYAFLAEAFFLGPLLKTGYGCRGVLGHTYYLTGQLVFTVCFNPIQDFMQWWLATGGSQLGQFLIIAFASAAGFGATRTMDGVTFLPMFTLGAVVGQACLQIKLDYVQEKAVAWACDILAVLLFVQAFSPAGLFYMGLASSYSPWILCIAFLIFGSCRSRCFFGRLLASPLLNYAELSYVIYIFHPVVFYWYRVTNENELDTWRKVFTFDYAGLPCHTNKFLNKFPIYPFAHLFIFVLVLFLGMVVTAGFHNPCHRFINRNFSVTSK
jgi:hypothetical protein